VQNLTHDGLHSRQLHDLAAMLKDETKTYAEIRNIIEQIQRNYHHLIQRVISPFEKMREKLGFTEEELRAALANIQRYMHDLNSIAYFTDIVHSHIEGKDENQIQIESPRISPSREPYDVIHLSHRDEIIKRVENEDPTCNLRDLYGSKGSGLIYISYLNIPTRDGFILPTTLSQKGAHNPMKNMEEVVLKHLKILEADIAKRDKAAKIFGNPDHPLLIAVRGGSVFSMPGILSTVLFVGMNDKIAEGIAKKDPWCAYDAYRRFLAIYGQAVWGVDMEAYNLVEETKGRYKVKYKYDLPWEGMREIAEMTKKILDKEGHGKSLEEVLANPHKQLFTAINTVFHSWNSEAARRYREIKGICNSWQSVAIIQEMALGNRKNEEIREGMDETRASLTGVIPRTRITELGMRDHMGDFKFSAAGDDLVGGLTKSISFRPIDELESFLPMLNRRLRHNVAKLRRFMGTDQEVEFTVEYGVLSILQSRAAEIGKNRKERAFQDPGEEATCGIGIRGSAFRGIVAFDKQDLEELRKEDLASRDDVDGVILLLGSPAPESIPLILSADALLSAKGGSTSHAAIAINGIEDADYSAVMSAAGLQVDGRKKVAVIAAKNGGIRHTIRKRDVISIHGMTGNVYVGTRTTI
jgi:pyruvate,orthophosphate dikinase